MALRGFTPSEDGVLRASVQVTFRVGADILVGYATQAIWDACGYNPEGDFTRYAAALTKASIESDVRDGLRLRGYEDWAGAEDIPAETRRAAEAKVRELWPELSDDVVEALES